MSTHLPGAPVDIVYTDGVRCIWIHGHIHHEEAIHIARDVAAVELDETGGDPEDVPEYTTARHTYGRWHLGETEDGMGRVFRDGYEKDCGAFAVTRVS